MTTYNGVLCPELVQQFWNLTATSPAAPVNGISYVVYTYVAGTTTPTPTYTDASLGAIGGINTNPIVLNSAGQANIFLNPAVVYKFVFTTSNDTNPPTSPIYTVDNVYPSLTTNSTLSASQIGMALFPQSAAEIAAGVVPTNYQWPQGDPRRYGANLNGATDDTGALIQWGSVGGALTFPSLSTVISGTITLTSNTTINFSSGGTITSNSASANIFTLLNLNDVIIRGGTFIQTAATGSVTAGVSLVNCINCTVEECNFNGMLCNGISGTAVSYCTFRANYFYTSQAAQIQDSGDINITPSATITSSFNVIDGNFCFGGAEFGIAVWDPYAGVLPIHNVVTNNRIGGQSGYGILLYMPDAGDSYNQVIGNHIENVTGAITSNTSSGTGIYCTGVGLGGTVVSNNTIRNCCISTANASLAPAGIGVNEAPPAGGVPITITGNVISDMTQYHGILVTGATGVVVSNNTVRMPATQTTLGAGISIVNTNGAVVSGNTISLLTTTQSIVGILLEAISAAYSGASIANNVITGGHYSHIRLVNDGELYEHVSISGNICSGGDTSCIPLIIESGSCTDVTVTGNSFVSTAATAVSQTGCQGVRYSANFLTGTGAILLTAGTCTGSFYDKTNYGTGAGAGVSNAATGFIVEQLGTASPAAGTWAVGDTVQNSAPTTSGVYEWICTVAGTGGGSATFKTISNT